MTNEFTAEEWAETLRGMRSRMKFDDDDLRSITLGAIRSLTRNGELEGIQAALAGLDIAIDE